MFTTVVGWARGTAAGTGVAALLALVVVVFPRPLHGEAPPEGTWLVTPTARLPGAGGVPPGRNPTLCTLPRASATGREAGTTAAGPVPAEPGPPAYYGFPLVTTSRVPGTARADGTGRVVFPSSSPFGVALADDGSYRYDLVLSTEGLPPPRRGRYVVWITTPSLDHVRRLGDLPEDGRLRGRVDWNKFLVVLTLEPEEGRGMAVSAGSGGSGPSSDAPTRSGAPPEMWSGPIVMRGMSRSGMMHTMAGHGPFEEENCAAYGY